MIRKLLIANRGEIAVRIMRGCRERGVTSVAVYSEADAKALHVRTADEALCIGPAPAAQSYLNIPALLRAAATSGADAVHPGYGFLSENAKFAAACEQAGLTWVGPPSDVIARMGSKIEARRLMQKAGVPVVPGETPDDQSDEGLQRAVERVGLPVLVKASAGGGGKGMRHIHAKAETVEAIQAARREAVAAFGDGTLYVERLIQQAHHVEVQVFGDAAGSVVHLFERECSVQRRHQKVIEESHAPSIPADLRTRIATAGAAAARAAGYRNAGTVEFLVDRQAGSFYFLEMNTRLQVEHPVTEAVTGLDLVHAQLDVAAGSALPWRQEALTHRGHAIEARVYAEDPDRGYVPQSGRLIRYIEPQLPGVRVDSGFTEGDDVSVYYDPMLAKVIASADTRDQAIEKLRQALRRYLILGVRTNIPFLLRVLSHPRFVSGEADIDFLDREAASLALTGDAAEIPLAVRHAIDAARHPSPALRRLHRWDPWNPVATASAALISPGAPDRPVVTARDGNRVWAFHDGRVFVEDVAAKSASTIASGPGASGLGTSSSEASGSSSATGAARSARASSGTGGGSQLLSAPMPGTVVKLLVAKGSKVAKGDTLAIMEAMKMELPVRALDDGVVTTVHVREGQLVDADAPLVELS